MQKDKQAQSTRTPLHGRPISTPPENPDVPTEVFSILQKKMETLESNMGALKTRTENLEESYADTI